MTQRKTASELKVGDVLDDLWFITGNRDKITLLVPYNGPLECLKGGFIASFLMSKVSMTIEPQQIYKVVDSIY